MNEIMEEGWEPEEENEGAFEEDGDLFPDLYVETATNLLYEVHLFDNFCLARLASPNVYADVLKFSHVEFSGKFHEYSGNHDDVRELLKGRTPDFMVE